MSKNKNIVLDDVLVESYAAEGKSIGRKEGKVIFIEQVVPGDIVKVRLTKNKKDWSEGYPLEYKSYSNERVKPFCQHFGVCGGCQWQMLPYKKQLEYKQQQVFDNLSRIGKIELPEILPIIGAEEDRFYRNKLEYTFGTKEFIPKEEFYKSKNSIEIPNLNNLHPAAGTLGFHARGFFDRIVHINRCWLQPEPSNSLRNKLLEFAIKNQFSFYNFREHNGLLRNLVVRTASTGEIMVNVVFGENDKEKIKRLLNFIVNEFSFINTVLYTLNLKKNDSLTGLHPVIFTGKGFITEKLEDFKFKIGPKSFFQTNTAQAHHLYQITRDFAELDGNQTVYDLYCGTGSIGIFCSRKAKKIIGVEMIEEAINDANENALLNDIQHASFFTGDVIDICNESFFELHGRPDVIIIDPPRAGMHEKLLKIVIGIEAPVVVYVSCNPATQARDLNILNDKYNVTRLQPLDMFPHTHHIENVVQLKLKDILT